MYLEPTREYLLAAKNDDLKTLKKYNIILIIL